jgi:hypothetical protein
LNLGHFSCFTFIFVSIGESGSLVSWCAGGRCSMMGNDEDHGRSRRPGTEDLGWSVLAVKNANIYCQHTYILFKI